MTEGRRFERLLLPGIVFQSVLIGGAYATGREIVQYGARFGALGVYSILAIFLGFSLMTVLAFEFARVHRTYDYRSFVRALIGPLWPLFDLLFVVMAVLVIAVVGAASGDVVEDLVGLPYAAGVIAVIVIVALLNVAGRRTIERFKTFGSLILYGGYAVFAGVVLSERWPQTMAALRGARAVGEGSPSTAAAPEATALAAFGVGILYVGYNLATLPATFFTLDRQTTRGQAVCAGLIAGLLATVPFVLTYLAVLGYWPDETVTGAPVPWIIMLRRVGGAWLLALFALVIFWTLVETSTGMIHAIVDRIAVNLAEIDRPPMSRGQVGGLTVFVLAGAALLSRVGLIDLVARGYTAMAYGFLALFALPLLTVGVARIRRASGR